MGKSTLRRAVTTLSAVLMLLVGIMSGATANANAKSLHPSLGVSPMAACPSGYVCLWDGINYSGGIFASYDGGIPNFVGYYFSDGVPLNDNAMSIANFTNMTINFYIDAGYYTLCFTEPPGGYRADLRVEGCPNALSSYLNVAV